MKGAKANAGIKKTTIATPSVQNQDMPKTENSPVEPVKKKTKVKIGSIVSQCFLYETNY